MPTFRDMRKSPKACRSLLHVVVLALVLALFPGKARSFEAPYLEIPVLLVAAGQSQSVEAGPGVSRHVAPSRVERVESHEDGPRRFGEGHAFVRIVRRFLTKQSWLC